MKIMKKNFLLFILLLIIISLYFNKVLLFNQKNLSIKDFSTFQTIYKFFIENMINPEGGVYTNYKHLEISNDDDITKGHYVLSESQGLLLEFAILNKDKDMFLKSWNFLKTYMLNEDGSFIWRVNDKYEKINKSTSTLDDLEIISQLINAINLWPELKNDLNPYIILFVNNFNNYTYNHYLTNGYNLINTEKFLELDSAYIDLLTLKKLCNYDNKIKHIYKSCFQLINKMKINSNFPFTYKRFYLVNEFIEKKNEINLIETLLVSLHLSQINKLPKESLKWLINNIDNKIYAYYFTNGKNINDIESSAVYALIAQIAYLEKNNNLYEKSLKRASDLLMESILDPEKYDIMSYDILRVLISYSL